MRINSVNNNYLKDQKQQSFGAIRGKNFDYTLTKLMPVYCNDSDKLARLAAEQAALAKTGQDFNSKFDRLVITNSKGEEVHPIMDFYIYGSNYNDLYGKFFVNASVGNTSKEEMWGKYNLIDTRCQSLNLDYLFQCIEITAKRTAEAMAESFENVKFALGIKPPPKPLAEVVLPEFSTISGIPEEQAKLILPNLIEQLKTPAGKTATEKELLEIAQDVGCMPPSLSQAENQKILDEVERLSPTLSDEDFIEMLNLKKTLNKVA